MLSRVANSIYWMNRYLERADNVARFVRVNIHLMLDLELERQNSRWETLVYASGDHEDFFQRYSEANEVDVLHFLTFDKKNPNSILSCIVQARENARTVREHIPSEMWESINDLFHQTQKFSRKRHMDDLQEFYHSIQGIGHLIAGQAEDMMAHGEAWHYARLGRMLERADKTARIIDIKYFSFSLDSSPVLSAYDAVEWGAVLRSVNAFEMYRKEHHSFDYRNVAQFLLLDTKIPRSVAYCVNTAADSLAVIVGETPDAPVINEIESIKGRLEGTDLDKMLTKGLHEFIDAFQYQLNAVDETIHQSFFAAID